MMPILFLWQGGSPSASTGELGSRRTRKKKDPYAKVRAHSRTLPAPVVDETLEWDREPTREPFSAPPQQGREFADAKVQAAPVEVLSKVAPAAAAVHDQREQEQQRRRRLTAILLLALD